jgi:Tat protein translocase TatB subunit
MGHGVLKGAAGQEMIGRDGSTIPPVNANLTISEILTIAVVILIVFGPQRLPEMARKAGEMITKFRKMASSLRTEFTSEYGDLAKPLSDIERDLRAAKDDIKASLPQMDQIGPHAPARPAAVDPSAVDPSATGATDEVADSAAIGPSLDGSGDPVVAAVGDGPTEPASAERPVELPTVPVRDDDPFDQPHHDDAPAFDDETGS